MRLGCSSVDSFFFSSRRRHTRWTGDWSSDVCSSDLPTRGLPADGRPRVGGDLDQVEIALARVVERLVRSEERRVGKSVDLGGRRIIKKKKSTRAVKYAETWAQMIGGSAELKCTKAPT